MNPHLLGSPLSLAVSAPLGFTTWFNLDDRKTHKAVMTNLGRTGGGGYQVLGQMYPAKREFPITFADTHADTHTHTHIQ